MRLTESYTSIKESIVAFAPYYFPRGEEIPDPVFPHIFGTGFVVREDGIIATNEHIVEHILSDELFRPADLPKEDFACIAIMFKRMQDRLVFVNLTVTSYALVNKFIPAEVYYGPDKPDIAFLQVNAKGLPVLELDDSIQEEGTEIATAGYPLGTELFTLPGYLHQINPTLQRGIVCATLPFPGPNPHAYMINVMTQGGASGSPVFLTETGKVVGMVYGGCQDEVRTSIQTPRDEANLPHRHTQIVPTNMSYAVPSKLITSFLNTPNIQDWKQPKGTEHFEVKVERASKKLADVPVG